MANYEYKIIFSTILTGTNGLEEMINKWAEDSWEPINISSSDPHGDRSIFLCLMRRIKFLDL